MNEELPAVSIIGGGPIGIEAALYARYLGYPVTVFEQGEICQHVREWGHVQLFSPFRLNSSSLGLSALQAQFPEREWPDPEQLHTGNQWVSDYLEPLSRTDLIRNCFRTGVRVASVSRDTTQADSIENQQQATFRLLLENREREQSVHVSDFVIDAAGTWGVANPIGQGGMPAVGEASVEADGSLSGPIFSRRIPDLKTYQPESGETWLLIGRGYSAATNLVQLAQLHERLPKTRCIWITRSTDRPEGPLKLIEDDALKYRNELAREANRIALNEDWVDWQAGTELSGISHAGNQFHVTLSNGQELDVDHVIANTGFQGDYEMLDPLHIHRCYVSGGPVSWAASIADSSGDCLQQTSAGPEAIRTTEPGFFILGSKSYARDPRFLFATGLQQIRDAFRIIADRDSLDLYSTMTLMNEGNRNH